VMIKPEEIDRLTTRAGQFLWDMILFLVVFTFFMVFGLLAAWAGGFSKPAGAMLSVAWLVLFISPAVDRVLDSASRARRSPWFDATAGVIRVGRLTFAVAALVGSGFVWLTVGSWEGFLDLIRQFLRVFGLQ